MAPQPNDEPIKTFIESELLAYTFTYLDRSSADSLQKIIAKFFNPEDISTAKENLWKAYGDMISFPIINRRDGKESAALKDTSDIMKACHELDHKQLLSENIIFYARRLDKVPQHTPEELDISSVISHLAVRIKIIIII